MSVSLETLAMHHKNVYFKPLYRKRWYKRARLKGLSYKKLVSVYLLQYGPQRCTIMM